MRERLTLRMAAHVFDREVSLAPVMDRPWYARIQYHVGVRRARLQAIHEAINTWPRPADTDDLLGIAHDRVG